MQARPTRREDAKRDQDGSERRANDGGSRVRALDQEQTKDRKPRKLSKGKGWGRLGGGWEAGRMANGSRKGAVWSTDWLTGWLL